MWALLFILCIAVNRKTKAADLVEVFAYEQGDANIACPYPGGYESYEKYLCIKDCGGDDVLIKTTEGPKNRYSITDNRGKRIFTVTISNVGPSDAGKYWCGVTKIGKDIYTEVKLHVQPEWCCVIPQDLKAFVGQSVTLKCPYPSQHVSNRKFICKGPHRDSCQTVVTSGPRFRLQDDTASNSFSVTATELEAGDAGTYWCGSDAQWNPGNYTKIQLSVEYLNVTTVSPTSTMDITGSQSTHKTEPVFFHTVLYVVAAVLPLLLTVCSVILCKHTCFRAQASTVNKRSVKEEKISVKEEIAVDEL